MVKKCKIDWCENDSGYDFIDKSGYHIHQRLNGFCSRHHSQIKDHGRILLRTNRDKNEYINQGDYFEIILYKNRSGEKQLEIARTLVDKDDLDLIIQYKWCLSHGRPATFIKGKNLYLYQLILGKQPRNKEIDHIDNNPLNNRKSNLRIVTRSQNMMNVKTKNNNTSGKTGVHFRKDRNKWTARIQVDRKQIILGIFKTRQNAVKARKRAELKYFGEFAHKDLIIN